MMLWPDFVCVAVGTGGTISIINSAFARSSKNFRFSALKGDLQKIFVNLHLRIRLISNFFEGYGKVSNRLISFISHIYQETKILFGSIYTGKLVLAL
jgi:1-aminocyclopropane-1-carboxylate deaminase